MADGRIELAKARILVTNDDGIGSPGIKLLEEIARDLSPDVWVVAPEQEQSAASHSLTTRRPLRMSELAERRYAVDGTPTDCVMLAIKHLLREHRPDLAIARHAIGQAAPASAFARTEDRPDQGRDAGRLDQQPWRPFGQMVLVQFAQAAVEVVVDQRHRQVARALDDTDAEFAQGVLEILGALDVHGRNAHAAIL